MKAGNAVVTSREAFAKRQAVASRSDIAMDELLQRYRATLPGFRQPRVTHVTTGQRDRSLLSGYAPSGAAAVRMLSPRLCQRPSAIGLTHQGEYPL